MCDDPKEGGAARGVSRVGYVGAHARFVRRAVRYRSESRRFSRGVRRSIARAFSALPEGGRRSSAAGLEMGRSRRRAVGRRHGDGRRVRGFEVGRHRPRPTRGIARALTSAHRSAMSGGDMTRRRGGVSPRETVQLRDTRHSARTRAAPPLSLTVPSHTLYRHSTALKAWNPRKQH